MDMICELLSELITEVHSRQPLWNASHKDYHNRTLIDDLWEEIAEKLEISKEDCKKKWKNLRDRYRLELKRLCGDDRLCTSQWVFHKRMEFIRKFMRSSVTLSRENEAYDETNDIDENEQSYIDARNQIEIIKNEISLDDYDDSTRMQNFSSDDITNAESCNAIKRKLNEDVNEKHYSPKQKRIQRSYANSIKISNTTETEDFLYFRSLLGYMEKFTPIQKLRVRSRVISVIINELEEIEKKESFSAKTANSVARNDEQDTVDEGDGMM